MNEYYTDSKTCESCRTYFGSSGSQGNQCIPCYDLVRSEDAYSSALAYELSTDPYNQVIDNGDDNHDNGNSTDNNTHDNHGGNSTASVLS